MEEDTRHMREKNPRSSLREFKILGICVSTARGKMKGAEGEAVYFRARDSKRGEARREDFFRSCGIIFQEGRLPPSRRRKAKWQHNRVLPASEFFLGHPRLAISFQPFPSRPVLAFSFPLCRAQMTICSSALRGEHKRSEDMGQARGC